ncbi:MAG: hypothetical protein GXY06_03905 [Clostridiaceae bacterium]|nr:hypothetical protein [Clostridiaceae bacterium]
MSHKQTALTHNSVTTQSSDQGIALATFLVIIGLILSKMTGFLRDVLVVNQFPELIRESWSTAFLIPDFIFNLLVGGSISAAITPSLARSIQTGDEKQGFRSVSIFISSAMVVMGFVVVICMILAGNIFPVLYPKQVKLGIVSATASSARILFPQIFFMMLAAFSIGILNAYKKFTATAFGPVVYNTFVIISIAIFAGETKQSLYLTVLGVMFAAMLYFCFQAIVGRRYLKSFRFSLSISDPGFKKLFWMAVPILVSSSIIQVNRIILSNFADSFDASLQNPIQNANTLWQLPYGIFAVGVGSVMLPSLAGHFAGKDFDKASRLLSSSLKSALFMTIPMMGFLLLMPEDIVRAAFRWSSVYTDEQIKITSLLLTGYAAATVIHTVVFVFNQAFYAIGKTKVPFFSGLISLAVTITMCTVLIGLRDNPNPIYLPVSYITAGAVCALFLVVYYFRHRELRPRELSGFIFKSLICFIGLGCIVLLLNLIDYQPQVKALQLAWLAIRGIVGLGVYMTIAWLLKMPELEAFISKVTRRFKRTV